MANEVKITISGMEQIQRNLSHLTPYAKLLLTNALGEAAVACMTDARKNCPVGTPESTHKKKYHGGRLRSSIRFQRVTDLWWQVFTDVFYAPFVELGTRKMKARPFLKPAFEKQQTKLMNKLIRILKTNPAGGE